MKTQEDVSEWGTKIADPSFTGRNFVNGMQKHSRYSYVKLQHKGTKIADEILLLEILREITALVLYMMKNTIPVYCIIGHKIVIRFAKLHDREVLV
jgi:hypothetical protein